MNSLRLMALAAVVTLAGCGDESQPAEPPLLTPVDDAAVAAAEEVPVDESYGDETVLEVEPEIGGSEPMDAAEPMADAAPMTDDFGGMDDSQNSNQESSNGEGPVT